jgi:penicillin-binding protein 1A
MPDPHKKRPRNRKIRTRPAHSPKPVRSGSRWRGLFKWVLWSGVAGLVLVLAGAGVAVGLYRHYSKDLPRIESLNDYRPPTITAVYAADGAKIGEFYKERRIVTPLEEMAPQLINAFVAAEDARFFEHRGLDFVSIFRAALKNLEAGTVVQGGSTITQQVTKSFLLTPERKWSRKFREAILAYRIDKAFSKEEILYLYLNQIYLGHGAYGVEAAAQNYFGVSADELTLDQCALIAGLPQAPSEYSPLRNPQKALARRKYVLGQMAEEGFITAEDAERATAQPLALVERPNWFQETTPYYTEHVRRYVEETYGDDALYNQGLEIHTAVDVELQRAARRAVNDGLRELDKRHNGYRGPLKSIRPDAVPETIAALKAEWDAPAAGTIVRGVVSGTGESAYTIQLGGETAPLPFSSLKWALRGNKDAKAETLLKSGDLIEVRLVEKSEENGGWKLALEQPPEVQGALVSIEGETGLVRAMVGGSDYGTSQFNRAVQAKRQPGSAFKPIIYAAALDHGYTPATVVMDNAFVYRNARMNWKPRNYDRQFHGPNLMRTALAKSRNLSTINILDDIGVDYAIQYARKLGIESDLAENLSISLGSSGVSPLELTLAYSVFANGGYRVKPVFITRILDRDGNELESYELDRVQAIEPETDYLITSLMESVIQAGTGQRVRAIGRPAAGKTGTTNDLHDAWFAGFTPDFVTGVWVGHDHEKPLGRRETGSKAASPIWLEFMKKAHENLPVRDFPVPPGIVFTKVDAETGLLPSPATEKTIFECFKKGTVPTRQTPHANQVTEAEQLFKVGM